MASFRPVRRFEDLPALGQLTRSTESTVFEFKSGYNPDDQCEMAKDIAAFSNMLGGAIIVGASRDEAPLSYPGIPHELATRLSHQFDLAHRDRLSPKPIIERVIFPLPTDAQRAILSVTVHPYPDQAVGARYEGDCWRFPIRTGSQTTYLEPSMLPLFNANSRRATILLDTIEPDSQLELVLVRNGVICDTGLRLFRGTEFQKNIVKLETLPMHGARPEWHPLDQVMTVYFGADSIWRLVITAP